jgi:ubiquinone/menaquinone biosynthesis C-methylase UbiE
MVGSLDTEQIRRRYDERAGNWRLVNGITDTLLLLNHLRKKHLATATGAVLDVACGTGENFSYLGRATSITALDLSPEMVREADRRRREMGIEIELMVGDAQELPFSDGTFDHVVSAFSSCTFPDYVAAFQEMMRVVKPGGRILLLEHGRSGVGWIARRQDRQIDRVYAKGGCRNNRDVGAELAEAGLVPDNHVKTHLGAISQITILG